MADASSFTPLVPGFDFLQSLVKNAGAAMPSMGQWVAPTFDPDELEKRIEELKTVQFWLEQNARLLGATIQALEVQRMTLSTLKTMNVQMGDLRDAMKIRIPGFTPPEPKAVPTPAPKPPADAAPEPAGAGADDTNSTPAVPGAAGGVVDPMQWWGALTKQFTELASAAMKENPVGAIARQSMDAASQGLKKALAVPVGAAGGTRAKAAGAGTRQQAAGTASPAAKSRVARSAGGAAKRATPRRP